MLSRKGDRNRRGSAVVELAVCLPVLVLIALATIEACAMIYLKQSLKIAAFEGARVGLVPEASSANVTNQCEMILESRDVVDYAVTVTPSDPTTLGEGDYLRVSISAPCNENSLIGGWFYRNQTLDEAVEVLAE